MTRAAPALDLLETSIEDGTTLIEASAGTGKTYSVAGLVVRLLLEGRVDGIGNILVMTFTNAATAELKERIRGSIQKAGKILHGDRDTGDEFLRSLCSRHASGGAAVLRRALRDIDDLTVVTIHGFCRRMLDQHALETGTLFDVDYGPDDRMLIARAADAFWRDTFYPRGDLLAAAAIGHGWTPATFEKDYRTCSHHPGIEILPSALPLDQAVAALEEAAGALRAACRDDTLHDFFTRAKFNKSKNSREFERTVPSRLQAARRFGEGEDAALAALFALAPSKLDGKIGNKSKDEKAHRSAFLATPVAHALDAVARAAGELELALRLAFVTGLDAVLDREKHAAGSAFYDDLLRDLHDALADEARAASLERVATAQFQAVLVDEFQDTDTRQYAIFEGLFGAVRLFYVGDPKQSIYAFRGADVFAYLRAKLAADRELTLDRNFRSDEPLVGAVNAVFARTDAPFLFDGIPFHGAKADAAPGVSALRGDDGRPLEWVWLAHDGNKSDSLDQAAAATAAEILALVSDGGAHIAPEDRNVEPRDIAVLVRKNIEAERVHSALERAGVPAVVSQAGSVFESEDALDLHVLLAAVLAPTRPSTLRAALATRVMGYDAADIAALESEPDRWEKLVDEFDHVAATWQRSGFVAMAHELLARFGVRERLLGGPRGARRLTNLLHLVELVQKASEDHHLGPEGTLHWLALTRADASDRNDDSAELRLETDEHAVHILTIHKSKGLQFPIVFCPTLHLFGDGSGALKKPAVAHVSEDRVVYHADPKADPAISRTVVREARSENARLAYVALTRAKYRCYVIADPSAGVSVLHQLLGCETAESLEQELNALCDENAASMRIRPAAIIRRPGTPFGRRFAGGALGARTFPDSAGGRLAPQRIASFSSLRATAAPAEAEIPDHLDPHVERETAAEPARGIFAFARGARAGTCLHEVFERCDFTRIDSEDTGDLVQRTLRRHGLDRADLHDAAIDPVRVVERMLADVVAAPLPSAGFSLAGVEQADRLTEWQFHMPMARLSQQRIGMVLAEHARSDAERAYAERVRSLGAREIQGFLAGYVDCIFVHEKRWYVVDWKSNHLGNRVADYDDTALVCAMHEHHYVLQYHLYLVALHRYLRRRLHGYEYDRDFGGAYYAFLRGMTAGSSGGWHADKPSRSLIEALDALLTGSTSA